jgi:hypothetical protein
MGRFEEAIGPLRAKFEALAPHLNERQRRLLYGAEARQLGAVRHCGRPARLIVSRTHVRSGRDTRTHVHKLIRHEFI